mmetsp:Transcript_26677/g.30674  ORF Transcript_26677/g.30674 Transcript_26677/m.30674 type:complete len:114 (+) Transcript_26677:1585-1926(+)
MILFPLIFRHLFFYGFPQEKKTNSSKKKQTNSFDSKSDSTEHKPWQPMPHSQQQQVSKGHHHQTKVAMTPRPASKSSPTPHRTYHYLSQGQLYQLKSPHTPSKCAKTLQKSAK